MVDSYHVVDVLTIDRSFHFRLYQVIESVISTDSIQLYSFRAINEGFGRKMDRAIRVANIMFNLDL